MPTYTIEPFGDFEKYTLSNAQNDAIEIVPAFGGNVLDIRFGGVSVLDGYRTPEELIAGKWSKNILLFPFPNRLKDGTYSFGGNIYTFPINNAATNNAIHGFSKDVPLVVTAIDTDENAAKLTAQYQHDGKHTGYPFRFIFEMTVQLRGGAFDFTFRFFNREKRTIPVGLGWHPYFKMSEKSDDSFLQMPESQLIEIDDRMLPTGVKIPFNDFIHLNKINKTTLDNGFYIIQKATIAETILASDKGKLTFWQEIGAGKWNFLQIFTPPHRQSVAIEPMTCNIDAFNNGDGLTLLEPDGILSGSFGIQFRNDEIITC